MASDTLQAIYENCNGEKRSEMSDLYNCLELSETLSRRRWTVIRRRSILSDCRTVAE